MPRLSSENADSPAFRANVFCVDAALVLDSGATIRQNRGGQVRGKRGRNTSKRLIVKSVSLSVMLGPEESTRRLSYRLRSELPILSWPKTYR